MFHKRTYFVILKLTILAKSDDKLFLHAFSLCFNYFIVLCLYMIIFIMNNLCDKGEKGCTQLNETFPKAPVHVLEPLFLVFANLKILQLL